MHKTRNVLRKDYDYVLNVARSLGSPDLKPVKKLCFYLEEWIHFTATSYFWNQKANGQLVNAWYENLNLLSVYCQINALHV